MTTPLHHLGSVPLGVPPTLAHARLAVGGGDLATAATADALEALGPLARSWGLASRSLPTVAAAACGDGDLGTLRVSWAGDEDATGWPALEASLLLTPWARGSSRLHLVAGRSPATELRTGRLDRPHRHRLHDVALRSFLLAASRRLTLTAPEAPATVPSGTRARRRPLFVHGDVVLPHHPAEIADLLAAEAPGLLERASAAAVAGAAPALEAGRFRTTARPVTRIVGDDAHGLGVLTFRWQVDEEATGWPAMSVTLVAAAAPGGTRVVALSPREPGYDLSRNRLDKAARARISRDAVSGALATLAEDLAGAATTIPTAPRAGAGTSPRVPSPR